MSIFVWAGLQLSVSAARWGHLEELDWAEGISLRSLSMGLAFPSLQPDGLRGIRLTTSNLSPSTHFWSKSSERLELKLQVFS